MCKNEMVGMGKSTLTADMALFRSTQYPIDIHQNQSAVIILLVERISSSTFSNFVLRGSMQSVY